MNDIQSPQTLDEFYDETSLFAVKAEQTLRDAESKNQFQRNESEVFVTMMISIRGTAEQLGLPHVAKIAYLGEELCLKATEESNRRQVTKCIHCLWDIMEMVNYLIKNHSDETTDEQGIIINRLEKVLDQLGGARQSVTQEEVARLISGKN